METKFYQFLKESYYLSSRAGFHATDLCRWFYFRNKQDKRNAVIQPIGILTAFYNIIPNETYF